MGFADLEGDTYGKEADNADVMHVFVLCGFSKSGLSVKPVLVNEVGGLRDTVLAAFVGGETPRGATDLEMVIDKRLATPAAASASATRSEDDGGLHTRTQETSQELEPSGDRQVATLSLLKSFDRQGGDPRLWYSLWCRGAGVNEKEQSAAPQRASPKRPKTRGLQMSLN